MQFCVKGSRAQMKVDEAGTGDLDFVDSAVVGHAVDDAVAISRGFLRAGFARRIAILLAKSPWLASRVRSTVLLSSKLGGSVCQLGQLRERVRD